MKVRKFDIVCFVFCILLMLLGGCMNKGTLKSGAKSEHIDFAPLSNKRTPKDGTRLVNTGDKPTKVYHWTRNELALTNTHQYLFDTLSFSLKQNIEHSSFKTGGAVGNGLYFAADPFSTRSFGDILVELTIEPKKQVCLLTGKELANGAWDLYSKAECPALLYDYTPNKALVVYDAGLLNLEASQLKATRFEPLSFDEEDFESYEPIEDSEIPSLKEFYQNYAGLDYFRFLTYLQKKPNETQKLIQRDLYLRGDVDLLQMALKSLRKSAVHIEKLGCANEADELQKQKCVYEETKEFFTYMFDESARQPELPAQWWADVFVEAKMLKQKFEIDSYKSLPKLREKLFEGAKAYEVSLSVAHYFDRYQNKHTSPSIVEWKDIK